MALLGPWLPVVASAQSGHARLSVTVVDTLDLLQGILKRQNLTKAADMAEVE